MDKKTLSNIKKEISSFNKKHPNGIVIIRGTTATGKTELSLHLADFFPIEIISSDSRQIFTGMDIGTDKVDTQSRKKIPHHQIDIVTPDTHYTAGQWHTDAENNIENILLRKKIPVIVGGTGLYIDTIYKNFAMPEVAPDYDFREGLYAEEEKHPGTLHDMLKKVDPISAAQIHPNSSRYLVRALEIHHVTGTPKSEIAVSNPVKRPLLMIGLRREKENNNKRILTRVHNMIKQGLIEEVQGLLDTGYDPILQSMQGIGYKQTVAYLRGDYDQNQLIEEISNATGRYAKRQRTRLRRYIRDAENDPKKNVTYKIYNL